MNFEIDVSGEDIFNEDYVICIASEDNNIKGFKMTRQLINTLNSRYGQNLYRYKKSKKGRTNLKIRLYCITIYHLFKSLKIQQPIKLTICRDFNGKEQEIKDQIKYFLIKNLNIDVEEINFAKLASNSLADHYAYLMRRDTKNKIKTYVNITVRQFEEFLE